MDTTLTQLMDARHKAFMELDAYTPKGQSRAGLAETFAAANRAYVQARDKQQQRQITAHVPAA